MGGSYAYNTANLMSGTKPIDKKVTVNLEDAILEEQKLFQILEVSQCNLVTCKQKSKCIALI